MQRYVCKGCSGCNWTFAMVRIMRHRLKSGYKSLFTDKSQLIKFDSQRSGLKHTMLCRFFSSAYTLGIRSSIFALDIVWISTENNLKTMMQPWIPLGSNSGWTNRLFHARLYIRIPLVQKRIPKCYHSKLQNLKFWKAIKYRIKVWNIVG